MEQKLKLYKVGDKYWIDEHQDSMARLVVKIDACLSLEARP
jgi:hypothetical protein